MFVVPEPSFAVDGFTDTAENTEGGEIEFLNMLLAETTKEADSRWCTVELSNIVLVDGFPVSRGRRIYGRRFEYA
jgi:hypothetical protein